jgi:hypothetical protein
MLPSSLLIRDMPRQIKPEETRREHEGVKREPGQKRIPNHILNSRPIPKKTATVD